MKKVANDRVIHSITPFTTLDFKDHLSCIIWFGGCNMRCKYCYNVDVVLSDPKKTVYDALEFLSNRKDLLDGVVLSGGEATMYSNLVNFAYEIKKLGYRIKLDTNGSNPAMLQELLKEKLIDFISFDYKAPAYSHESITKSKLFNKTIDSLKLLIQSDIDYEVRTTVHSDLLNENDIKNIISNLKALDCKAPFYVQNFQNGCEYLGDLKEQEKPIDLSTLQLSHPILQRNFYS